jgi:hypothetical protein
MTLHFIMNWGRSGDSEININKYLAGYANRRFFPTLLVKIVSFRIPRIRDEESPSVSSTFNNSICHSESREFGMRNPHRFQAHLIIVFVIPNPENSG